MKIQTENRTMITLNPGSKRERQFDVNLSGQIPDLWEIAHLPELDGYAMGKRPAKDMILETWQLAHDMQKALAELLAQRDALREALEHAIIEGLQPEVDRLRAMYPDTYCDGQCWLALCQAKDALALCEPKDKEGV